jgi:hypothetical protein
VILWGFNALMMSSAERSSAARATPSPEGKARPTARIMQVKVIFRVFCADIFVSLFLGALGPLPV